MLLIEARNIKKTYIERKIIDIEDIKVYSQDRIGIVGLNGAGKTTLIDILCGKLKPDSGTIKCYGIISCISQLEASQTTNLDNKIAAKFKANATWQHTLSGGEKTRFKIAEGFAKDSNLLFADEPTSNLDIEGIEMLENKFNSYNGAIVLISHDRELLDKICNKIYELDDGHLKVYNGNYSSYKLQKEAELKRLDLEYLNYKTEKHRLENAVLDLQYKVRHMKKTPKRMGNSEARLHRLGNQRGEQNVDDFAKRIKSRIEHLEVKEKPKKLDRIKLDALASGELTKKILVSGKDINKAFQSKQIFKNAAFDIYNGTKTALIGLNGSGKTTLLRMIMASDPTITIAEKIKIGYFSQELEILDKDKSIIENVMESSIYNETFARILLSRLLFKREDVYKKVNVLSGGEKVKASFAKMFLQDINMLILDEPTNYLDIYSMEAIEESFKDYDRTILFVSHDRQFVSTIADRIIAIENQKLICFNGSYEEYLTSKADKSTKEKNKTTEEISNRILILQNRLSELISRISLLNKNDNKELLENEYAATLKELTELKTLLKN